MSQSLPEKKWVENEVIFKQANERIAKELAATKTIAQEEDQETYIKGIDDVTLRFYCECANEKCRQRIPLTPKEYSEQHRNNSQFILVPGHHIPKVERIVFEGNRYIIVEKYMTPPDTVGELNATDL